MRGPNQKIFLSFLVSSFLLASSFLQAADFQTACLKTVVSKDTFRGKVVGVSDGDINTGTALKWQCASRRVWKAIPHHVKNGSWYPVCGIESIKLKRRGFAG
jgi:hypothetical protein